MTPWWQFLGAHQAPLTRDIPVERLWPTPALREWPARFAAVLAEHGLAVLTGESGVGKSTALRLVWQTLTPTHYLPLYLPVSDAWTPRQLYRALARLLDLPPTPFADDTERQVRKDPPWGGSFPSGPWRPHKGVCLSWRWTRRTS